MEVSLAVFIITISLGAGALLCLGLYVLVQFLMRKMDENSDPTKTRGPPSLYVIDNVGSGSRNSQVIRGNDLNPPVIIANNSQGQYDTRNQGNGERSYGNQGDKYGNQGKQYGRQSWNSHFTSLPNQLNSSNESDVKTNFAYENAGYGDPVFNDNNLGYQGNNADRYN